MITFLLRMIVLFYFILQKNNSLNLLEKFKFKFKINFLIKIKNMDWYDTFFFGSMDC